jgi:hypothetical protein
MAKKVKAETTLYIVLGADLLPFKVDGKRVNPTDFETAKRLVDDNPGEAVVVNFKEYWDNYIATGGIVGLADVDTSDLFE